MEEDVAEDDAGAVGCFESEDGNRECEDEVDKAVVGTAG